MHSVALLALLSLATASNNLPVSPNGECGPDYGLTCQGSVFGNCCSQYGFCGSSTAYCGQNCQSGYGTCNTENNTPAVSQTARCGTGFGFTCQGSQWGNCCSQHSWCGSTSAYCGQGCQNGFGECTNQQSSSSRSSSPARSSTSSRRSSSTSAAATTTSTKLSTTTSSKPVSSSSTRLVSSSVTSVISSSTTRAAISSSTRLVSPSSSNVVSSTSIVVSSSAISSVVSSSSSIISSTPSLAPSSTSTPTPSCIPSVNLLLNPSYEQGTLDWVTIGSQDTANISTPTGDAHQGNSYYAATTLYLAAENLNTIFLEQPTVVIPATTTVYVSVWMRVTVPAGTTGAGAFFSSNIYIDGVNAPDRVNLTPGQPWYNIQTSLTLTAGTHNIGLAIAADFPAIGTVVEVDDWLATVGPPVICVSV